MGIMYRVGLEGSQTLINSECWLCVRGCEDEIMLSKTDPCPKGLGIGQLGSVLE